MPVRALLILAIVVTLAAAKPAKVGSVKQEGAVVTATVAPAVKPTTSDTLSVDDFLGLVVGEDDDADDGDDDDIFPLLGGDLFGGLFGGGTTKKPKTKPVIESNAVHNKITVVPEIIAADVVHDSTDIEVPVVSESTE